MRDRITDAMRTLPPRVGEAEVALHRRIAAKLIAERIAFQAEARLSGVKRGRLDFLCEGGVGIEAKIGYSSRGRLVRQVESYLGAPEVAALVIVSERRVPEWLAVDAQECAEEAGKPLEIVELARGVAV